MIFFLKGVNRLLVPKSAIARPNFLAMALFGTKSRLTPFILLFLLSACSNYASRIRGPRSDFEAGRYEPAYTELETLSGSEDNDQLLYLMDLGTVYHVAGKYEKAIQAFLKAEKIAELRDYTSVSEEAGSVLLNENIAKYKGEDFEKVLINAYLAIDYTLLGKYDDALVECRKVNHKLDIMISKGGMPYEQNSFAKLLAAMLFEAQGELNDAFVDYRQLLKWKGKTEYLGIPLLRLADRLQAMQELQEYRKKFPNVKNYQIKKGEAEIILLLEIGRSPIKVPSPNFRLVPVFQRQYYNIDHGNLRVDGNSEGKSGSVYSVEDTAVRELDNRLAGIMAKKIGGVVLKQAAAIGVEQATDSPLAGAVTSLLLHLTDDADLRSWTTLPAELHVLRAVVPAGTHQVSLDLTTRSGHAIKGVRQWNNLSLKSGQHVFLHHRAQE